MSQSITRKYNRLQRKRILTERDRQLQSQGFKANQALTDPKYLVKAQTPYVKENN
jgi:hypothetical protein